MNGMPPPGWADATWLAIGGLAHFDLRALGRLHAAWPDAAAARAALMRHDPRLRGIVSPSRRHAVAAAAAAIDPAAVAATVAAAGAGIVATATHFGERLDPALRWPPVVSVLGDVAMADAPSVAIVGTRRATASGCRFAHDLAAALAAGGICIVSGLAFGIDAAAHRGALAGGSAGLAVLAGGVSDISPRRHIGLAAEMVGAGGALVSHVPPDAPSPGWRFPVRNRLIAGLADVVVVVEACERGGSLSTARHAADLGRPLLAVPGFPWAPASVGTNALLADGALVCRGVEDVVAALGLAGASHTPSRAGRAVDVAADVGGAGRSLRTGPSGGAATSAGEAVLDVDCRRVLDAVEYVPVSLEAVVAASGLPIVHVLGILGSLELAGFVACPTPASVVRTGPGAEVG